MPTTLELAAATIKKRGITRSTALSSIASTCTSKKNALLVRILQPRAGGEEALTTVNNTSTQIGTSEHVALCTSSQGLYHLQAGDAVETSRNSFSSPFIATAVATRFFGSAKHERSVLATPRNTCFCSWEILDWWRTTGYMCLGRVYVGGHHIKSGCSPNQCPTGFPARMQQSGRVRPK